MLRNRRKVGQEAAGTTLTFSPALVSPKELVDAIYQNLPYEEKTRCDGLTGTAVKNRDNGVMRIMFGRTLSMSWVIAISEKGEKVVAKVEDAVMADGLINHAKQLAEHQGMLEQIVKKVDPQAHVERTFEKVKWKQS